MPELRKRRSHLALLGVFAMVASVLAAVGSAPVSAEAGKADAAASYSACVGPATADAGFEDVAAGSVHDAAVNCIAYYGITRGTSATMFSPGRSISRWQLAVMLQRAAGPAGVDLPAAADVGFADIGDLGSSFQAAVNQMASLGVMSGTTATSFNPNAVVSRAGIAVALAQFLTKARVGPGGRALSAGTDGTFTIKQDGSADADTVPIDETFRDIGSVPFTAFQAIRALAEMGVVQGRGDQTFSPAGSVTRAQAAAFITRALAHTNARPAGLTMQTGKSSVTADDEVMLSISLRGDDFSVRDSAVVDVFSHTMEDAASAFNADGTCNSGAGGVTGVGAGGSAACTIELSDQVTESGGNLLVVAGTAPSESTRYWAWTGSTGASLDWDSSDLSRDNTAVSDAASVSVSVAEAAANARVSLSIPEGAAGGSTARYGTTVTVTIQLMGSNNLPIGISGRSYTWYATGQHAPASAVLPGTDSQTVTTDADGQASFTLTQADPRSKDPDQTTWTYYITAVGNAPAPARNNAIGFQSGSGTVIFDDASPRANKVDIDLQRGWTQIPASGTTSVTVTGMVTDLYGDPLRGHRMYFDLDGDDTFGCADVGPPRACGSGDDTIEAGDIDGTTDRLTRSRGTNAVRATYTVGGTDEEISRYWVAADVTGDDDVDDDNERAVAIHYWASAPEGFSAHTGQATAITDGFREIYLVDLVRNALVYNSDNATVDPADDKPTVYLYDDTSYFKYFVDGATDDVRWLTAAGFEARFVKHMIRNNNSPNSAMQILQYNAKTGVSVFEIQLGIGSSLDDPASN